MPADTQAGKPRIDLASYQLSLNGSRVRLERQPMELLIFLVQRKGQLVTRQEIIEKLWGKDVFVDVDGSINAAVRKIRSALRDDPASPNYLETVVGKGYRFVGEVEVAGSRLQPAATLTDSNTPQPITPHSAVTLQHGLPIAAIAIILLAAATWGWFRWHRATGSSAAPIRSIAVLPLANLSGDASQDYFAEGMTDELITELAKFRSLRVISRTSVIRYQGTKTPLPQIARDLRVDAVVEGAVVRSGDKLRITAQLIEASTDRHLWAESYVRDSRDVLTLQREIAGAIAAQVNANVDLTENNTVVDKRPVNSQAHEAYLRGIFFWNRWTEDGVRKSVGYFQQAIQADPSYAPAYAGLANSYIAMGDFGVGVLPPHQANTDAEQAALKAISLDETLAEGHAALALSRFRSDGDLSGVEKEFRRAIELAPGSATAHHWYSHYLLAVGRNEEAIAEGERAYDLSPIDPEMGVHMQFLYLFLHRYNQVIEQGRKTLELDPNFAETHWLNGQAYELKQMYKEAGLELQAAVELSGRRTAVAAAQGHFLAVSGDRSGALKILAELNALSEQRYVPSYEKALIYVGLGNKDASLDELEKAYAEGSHWMFILQSDARLDPLRGDARFQRLVHRVGVPQ